MENPNEFKLKPRTEGYSTELAKDLEIGKQNILMSQVVVVGDDPKPEEPKEPEWVEPKPKPNCKFCYGRGYEAINVLTKEEVVCRCILKQIEKNAKRMKQKINLKNPPK